MALRQQRVYTWLQQGPEQRQQEAEKHHITDPTQQAALPVGHLDQGLSAGGQAGIRGALAGKGSRQSTAANAAHKKALAVWKKCKVAFMLRHNPDSTRLNPTLLAQHGHQLDHLAASDVYDHHPHAVHHNGCAAAGASAADTTIMQHADATMKTEAAADMAWPAARAVAVAGMNVNVVKAYCSSLYRLTVDHAAEPDHTSVHKAWEHVGELQSACTLPAAVVVPAAAAISKVSAPAVASASHLQSFDAPVSGDGTTSTSLRSGTAGGNATERARQQTAVTTTAAAAPPAPAGSCELGANKPQQQNSAEVQHAAPAGSSSSCAEPTGIAWAAFCKMVKTPATAPAAGVHLVGLPHTPLANSYAVGMQTSRDNEESTAAAAAKYQQHTPSPNQGSHQHKPSSSPDIHLSASCSAHEVLGVKPNAEPIMNSTASMSHNGNATPASNLVSSSCGGNVTDPELACTSLGSYAAVTTALPGIPSAGRLPAAASAVDGQLAAAAATAGGIAAHLNLTAATASYAADCAIDCGKEDSNATVAARVSMWLHRAALLEDELQGRAMEVSEQLQQLAARKEMLEALLLSLQACTGGGNSGRTHDHSAPGANAHGSNHKGAAAPGKQGLGDHGRHQQQQNKGGSTGMQAVRERLGQEASHITATSAYLAVRASALGAALASLQGCQTVLASSRGTKLSPSSRLAVLQLVLGDVAARLPSENLLDLGVLQGLPPLDESGEEICRLVGAGSTAAAAARRSAASDGVTLDIREADSGVGDDYSPVSPDLDDTMHTTDQHGKQQQQSKQCWQQQLQQHQRGQQQRQWHTPASSCDARSTDDFDSDSSCDDTEDTAIISSVSKALSRGYYTPRPSWAYESRWSSVNSWAGHNTAAAAVGSPHRSLRSVEITPILESGWQDAAAAADSLCWQVHQDWQQQQPSEVDKQAQSATVKQPLKAMLAALSRLVRPASSMVPFAQGSASAMPAVRMSDPQQHQGYPAANSPGVLSGDNAFVPALHLQAITDSRSTCLTAESAVTSDGHEQQDQDLKKVSLNAQNMPATCAHAAGTGAVHGNATAVSAIGIVPAAPAAPVGAIGAVKDQLGALGAACLEQMLSGGSNLGAMTVRQVLEGLIAAVVGQQLLHQPGK